MSLSFEFWDFLVLVKTHWPCNIIAGALYFEVCHILGYAWWHFWMLVTMHFELISVISSPHLLMEANSLVKFDLLLSQGLVLQRSSSGGN